MSLDLPWIVAAMLVLGAGALIVARAALRPQSAGPAWAVARRPLMRLWTLSLGTVLGAHWALLHTQGQSALAAAVGSAPIEIPYSATTWPLVVLVVVSCLIGYLWFGAQIAQALLSQDSLPAEDSR